LLEKLGYRADVAGNGIEAIEALERQTYDLLLTDVQMPEMDGVEATRRIVERWPADARPRIVAMTAEAMQGDRERFLAAGMDDYLMKPVRIEELVASIKATPRRPEGDVPARVEGVPAPTGGPVDERVIDRLLESTGGDEAFMSDLIAQLLTDAPALVEAAWAALERGDAPEVHRAAHTLKSNAATFGALRLAEMCGELEAMAKDGALDGAAQRIDAIAVELGLVRVALMASDPKRDQPEDR
jgi:CheY-like chemotaxis protein/HPt (histidine-containing phosphotransfer) domain-containing protein